MNPYITAYAVAGDAVAATMPAAITSGVTEAVNLVGTAFTAITGNTVLCVFLGACSRQGRHEHFPLHENVPFADFSPLGQGASPAPAFFVQLERGFIYVRCY